MAESRQLGSSGAWLVLRIVFLYHQLNLSGLTPVQFQAFSAGIAAGAVARGNGRVAVVRKQKQKKRGQGTSKFAKAAAKVALAASSSSSSLATTIRKDVADVALGASRAAGGNAPPARVKKTKKEVKPGEGKSKFAQERREKKAAKEAVKSDTSSSTTTLPPSRSSLQLLRNPSRWCPKTLSRMTCKSSAQEHR
ncbi:hypothetical protein LCI18_008383 [Fusarium solani-melongenae]|uniref:Uncharacterized protein n=1 Tax=Fusarium solani subsp. cucurbitae TaxID=2747967 RepID=A0ACD3Z861_FUSSC|nr:hypothetical protein LCI18_008383 [Fusarium solani-melongenae]